MNNNEKKFIRLLLQQDNAVKALYYDTILELLGQLNRFKVPSRVVTDINTVWHKNKSIEKNIDRILLNFNSQFSNLIDTGRLKAFDISADRTNGMISDYVKGLPISGIAKEGIFQRSLEGFETFANQKLDISSSVWKTSQVFKDQIAFYGASGIGSGQSSAKISTDLKNYLQNPDKRFRRIKDPVTGKLKLSQPAKDFHPGRGVYRSSHKNALRLQQQVTNSAYRLSDQARWKNLPFVTGYEVKLSSQHPEPDICDSMVGKYPKNFIFEGFHVKCICFIVPILASKESFKNYLKTGSIGKKQIINTIPYPAGRYIRAKTAELARRNSKPYWLEKNFNYKDSQYVLKEGVGKFEAMPPKQLTAFSPEAPITKAENKIRKNSTFETAMLFDKNGKNILTKRGNKNSVAFSKSEVAMFKDSTLTHNHPGGWKYPANSMRRIGHSFSGADIMTAIKGNMAEVRAVTPNYTFILKRPASGWPDYDIGAKAYNRIHNKVFAEMQNRIYVGTTTVNKAQTVTAHEVAKRFAKLFKIEYIKRKDF